MQIKDIDINKIKPDVLQPRTTIDELDLREMSQSILTTGIINPIEIDKNFVIVTGERRWRASKLAGLATIPVRVVNLSPEDRFMRQVIENIHHNTMDDIDTARALKKLLESAPRDRLHVTKAETDVFNGITWLCEKTGKSRGYINEKLTLLKTSEQFQTAIKTNKIPSTFGRAIRRTPEEYRSEVEHKILSDEFKTTDAVLALTSAINREKDNPETVKKLLEIDYSELKDDTEVRKLVSEISPEVHERISKSYEPSQEISKIAESLKEWIRNNPKNGVGMVHAPRVIINLNFMKTLIDEWFKGETIKEIE